MNKKISWSYILSILSILCIVCLIILVLYPAPIKPIIRPFIKSTNYPLSADGENYSNYVIYGQKLSKQKPQEISSTINYDNIEILEEPTNDNDNDNDDDDESINNEDNIKNDMKKVQTHKQHKDILEVKTYNLNEKNAITPLNTNHKKLIVVFIGGSFLFKALSSHYGIGNKLYELFKNDNFNVMLLSYPVRFSATLQQSMLSINNTLQEIALTQYDEFYAIGYSAGALLASVFIQKEMDINYSKRINVPQIGLNFKKFIGICGLYYPSFENNSILTRLFKFYILKNTTAASLYTCGNSLERIPKLIISTVTDFLYNQTTKFIQTIPNTVYKVYTNPSLNHTFIENVDLKESKDAFELMYKFIIKQNDNIEQQ